MGLTGGGSWSGDSGLYVSSFSAPVSSHYHPPCERWVHPGKECDPWFEASHWTWYSAWSPCGSSVLSVHFFSPFLTTSNELLMYRFRTFSLTLVGALLMVDCFRSSMNMPATTTEALLPMRALWTCWYNSPLRWSHHQLSEAYSKLLAPFQHIHSTNNEDSDLQNIYLL